MCFIIIYKSWLFLFLFILEQNSTSWIYEHGHIVMHTQYIVCLNMLVRQIVARSSIVCVNMLACQIVAMSSIVCVNMLVCLIVARSSYILISAGFVQLVKAPSSAVTAADATTKVAQAEATGNGENGTDSDLQARLDNLRKM